jgi:hypothetical protein
MKRVLFAITAFSILSLGACNNAASKIKAEEEANTTENMEPAANQMAQPAANAANNNSNQVNVSPEAAAKFSFTADQHDFGTIEEGTVAKHDFEFTNTSDNPLIITNAQGSCGCTVPEWPREPIPPGGTGKIHVEFNSTNRTGNQTKQVTLTANTIPNKKILRISAQVNPKAEG